MKPEVEIYDTTLRDGSQGEGINFSVMDKLRIAERLDAFGIHYIEGGWPGSNPKDIEFFAEAKRKKFKHARLAAFGSTRRKGVAVESDDQVRLLLEAHTPVVTIFGKTWLLHVKEVLRTTPEENLAMIGDTVRYLKDHGKFVIYDAEHAFDGYKDDPDYALATWQAAEKAGVDFVVLGGLAAVLDGAPIATLDVDVVHSREPANLDRLLGVLGRLDPFFRIQPERRIRPEASPLVGSGHLYLSTRHGPLDLLGTIGRGRAYEDLLAHTVEMDFGGGVRIRVLDLGTVIAVKEEVGGEKDLAVLAVLKRTLREKQDRERRE